jgi:hypothetical protein
MLGTGNAKAVYAIPRGFHFGKGVTVMSASSRWDPLSLTRAAFLRCDYGGSARRRHRQASIRMHILPSSLRPASFPARALAGPQVPGPFRRYPTLRLRLEACARRVKAGTARRTDLGRRFRFGNDTSQGRGLAVSWAERYCDKGRGGKPRQSAHCAALPSPGGGKLLDKDRRVWSGSVKDQKAAGDGGGAAGVSCALVPRGGNRARSLCVCIT